VRWEKVGRHTFLDVSSLHESLQCWLAGLLQILRLLGIFQQDPGYRWNGLHGPDSPPPLCLLDSVKDWGERIFERQVLCRVAVFILSELR
jgi:hypothetical protein